MGVQPDCWKREREMRKSLRNFVVVALTTICFAVPVFAGDVVLEFSTHYADGVPPTGSGPWITATFSDAGTDIVHLTIVSHLVDAEHIKQINFNFDDVVLTLVNLVFTQTVGPTAGIATNVDSFNADGSFGYDMELTWGNKEFWKSPEHEDSKVEFDLTGIVGLTAASFRFMNVSPSNKLFYGAAHIGGIGEDEDSAWVGAQLIPLPQAWLLLAVGLLVVVPVVRRRFGSAA